MPPTLLLVALAHAGPQAAMDEFGTIEARQLHVDLQLDPAQTAYSGTSTVVFEHSKPVDEVVLHAADTIEIGEVAFVRGTRRWPATATRTDDEQVVIRAERPIGIDGFKLPRRKLARRGEPLFATPSFVAVEVQFTHEVHSQPYGLYRFEVDQVPYLVTQFEADDAREAFPCIDQPDTKVSLQMAVTVPKDLVALGNAPVLSETVDEAAGTKKVVFDRTRPMPTYAMALAVGPYVSIPIPGLDGVEGQVYTVPGRESDAEPFAAEIAPLLKEHEDWFGSPYPFGKKLDFLGVPEFAFGGMENPGLVIFGDRFLRPADQRSPHSRRWQQELISHEIAHMWFGDLVTLQWWDDFWLNESFAEYAGNRAALEVTGDGGFAISRVISTQGALQSDGRGTMRPVRTEVDPTRIFETTNFLAYPKGEALLRMLEHWMGPEEFQQRIQFYLNAHKDGNATSQHLFNWLEHGHDLKIAQMLTPWLDRPGGPLIHFELADNGLSWKQERYLAAGADAEKDVWWTTPVAVRWADDEGIHETTLVLDAPEGTAPIAFAGDVRWLFPHAEGIGYYAWTLPEAELTDLVTAAPEVLAPHERMALVGNLDLLTTAGVMRGGELLTALEAFSAETHPQVMQSVLGAQGFVGDVRDGKYQNEWAAYVQATRRPWLDRIGLEPVQGEDEEIPALRGRLLEELLYDGRDDAVREHFLAAGRAFLEDEANYDRTLTGTGLRELAKEAEPEMADTLLAKADATQDPRFRALYLGVLGRVEGAEDRVREMALDPETPLRDMWSLMFGLPDDDDEDEDRNLNWVIDHHAELAEKLPPQQRSFLARFGSGCDEERWARSKAFFGAEERRNPGVDRAIAEGDETLALCQAARELHAESVADVLAEYLEDEDESR